MITFLFMALIGAVILAAVAAMQADEFRVSRSALISAPPQALYEQVNNLRRWNAWSPWARLDPNAKNDFAGPKEGAGAIMRWAGNSKVGEGAMMITESTPVELVRLRLDFLKPFKATNTAEFAFMPQGQQTLVTWSMAGRKNFISKLMGLIMNCEKMVGKQFDQGLRNLEEVVTKGTNI